MDGCNTAATNKVDSTQNIAAKIQHRFSERAHSIGRKMKSVLCTYWFK